MCFWMSLNLPINYPCFYITQQPNAETSFCIIIEFQLYEFLQYSLSDAPNFSSPSMFILGVKNLESCPKEPRLPIYLLVGGCFGMIKLLSTLWRNIQTRRYENMNVDFDDNDSDEAFANKTYRTMDTLLFLFLFCWQIAGSYWTLIIWTPPFKQTLYEPSNWCDKTVYMFTCFQLCGSYFVMFVYVIVLSIIVCIQRCCYS